MSIGFGQNAFGFQLAKAFTVRRIIRNDLAPKDVWSKCIRKKKYIKNRLKACSEEYSEHPIFQNTFLQAP